MASIVKILPTQRIYSFLERSRSKLRSNDNLENQKGFQEALHIT